MSKVRVDCFGCSLDGFVAGPGQDLENPMGRGGMGLHQWVLKTQWVRQIQSFESMVGRSEGTTGVDNDFARQAADDLGAWIIGRNMFAPSRGPWPDDNWQGWWGEEPPYHCDVFVLTHHPRDPIEMKGGTVFHFVTDGIRAALDSARKSADGKDIRIGGGAATIRQYLEEGLVDRMHLAVGPLLLGQGEPLFAGLDISKFGFNKVELAGCQNAAHFVFSK